MTQNPQVVKSGSIARPETKCSDQVLAVLKAEGITPQELDHMLSSAAITSLRNMNRRFHNWLFRYQVKEGIVNKMFMHPPEHDRVPEWDQHWKCNGKGCKECGWSGEVPLQSIAQHGNKG
jgi:hypothetical protein